MSRLNQSRGKKLGALLAQVFHQSQVQVSLSGSSCCRQDSIPSSSLKNPPRVSIHFVNHQQKRKTRISALKARICGFAKKTPPPLGQSPRTNPFTTAIRHNVEEKLSMGNSVICSYRKNRKAQAGGVDDGLTELQIGGGYLSENSVNENKFPSGSLNQATLALLGAVQIPFLS